MFLAFIGSVLEIFMIGLKMRLRAMVFQTRVWPCLAVPLLSAAGCRLYSATNNWFAPHL